MEREIAEMLKENERRNAEMLAAFDPITGDGSVGARVHVEVADFPLRVQWLPREMLEVELVRILMRCGSVEAFLEDVLGVEATAEEREKVVEQWVRVRCRYDFPFWAALLVYIKNKGGGEDVLFRLTYPQRRFVERLEAMRLSGRPIRLVLLKARQWGGSTTSQLYMAWLQLEHRVGLNSLIIAHQGAGSDEIKDMFDRMIKAYPVKMLHELGVSYAENEPKLVGVGKSGSIYRVPQRNCKIKIGTAERPDSCRGGDYNLVHLSEVGLWKTTDGKKPEDIVRSACSGVLLEPYTMIVYESTANGTGNFFQREYDAAKAGQSQFEAMFVSWFDIEKYSMPMADLEGFARRLWKGRESEAVGSAREESGRYLWWLWERGARLEAIAWYVAERAKYNEHAPMASEYPSDDVEAFVHSGSRVFDKYRVEALRGSCLPARWRGELVGEGREGKAALDGLHFVEDAQGGLLVWERPEVAVEERVAHRYLVVVDIGGRGTKADYSVIVVFDRLFMMEGGRPEVVAQWYGHCDADLLAWRAAQIAKWYDEALLVIESNTLETHDRDRSVDGDLSGFILNQIRDVYDNLYARRQSEEAVREGLPVRYGFHTNVSTKPMIISLLIKVVREGLYVERDVRCLDEYLCYERKPNGSYGAIVGRHDDLLMTRAIGLHVCFSEMELPCVVPLSARRVRKKRVVGEASL